MNKSVLAVYIYFEHSILDQSYSNFLLLTILPNSHSTTVTWSRKFVLHLRKLKFLGHVESLSNLRLNYKWWPFLSLPNNHCSTYTQNLYLKSNRLKETGGLKTIISKLTYYLNTWTLCEPYIKTKLETLYQTTLFWY